MIAALAVALALPLYATVMVAVVRWRGWDLWSGFTIGNAIIGLVSVAATTMEAAWGTVLGQPVGGLAVLRGAAVGIAVALPVVGAAWSPTRVGRSIRGAGVDGIAPVALAYRLVVQVMICTVLFEELAFRGVLYALLQEATGAGAALWGSTCSFTIWHIALLLDMFAGHPVARRLPLAAAGLLAFALLGLGLGWLRATTDSLVVPLAAHGALDLVMISGMALAGVREKSAGAAA